MAFLSAAKTERGAVVEISKLARGVDLIKTYINRDKTIILVHRGQKPLSQGVRIVMAHIDSPRLDLKISPLYETENLVFFKTHYYGGIKKYQWPTLPLALHGVVVKKDGRQIEINLGDKADDPIFMITDLLPHLAQKQVEKKMKEAIEAEELNILVGSLPIKAGDKKADQKIKEKIKLNLLSLLNKQYGISLDDFISAEIQAVPAGAARELGFDRSLMAAYGHDDRICAYAAVKAFLDQKGKPDYTQIVLLADREEIGSYGATGMQSNFFYDLMGDLVGQDDRAVRTVLKNSKAISGDVTSALDPDYQDVHDPRNAARMGFGVALERHTGARGKYSTSEASAEYTAWIRNILDKNNVPWQPATLGKVDLGGGGTLAMFLAHFNMDVIDMGPPVFNMHAPYEIASKADLYASYLAYAAFLRT